MATVKQTAFISKKSYLLLTLAELYKVATSSGSG